MGDAAASMVMDQGTGLSQAATLGMGAGTAAMLGQILPKMAPMMGISNPAVLGALPQVGLAAGAGILGIGAGLGIGNALGSFTYGNDWQPQTLEDAGRTAMRLGFLAQDWGGDSGRLSAAQQLKEENPDFWAYLEGPKDFSSQGDRDALGAFRRRTGHKEAQFANFYAAARSAYGGTISEGTGAFEELFSLYETAVGKGQNAESVMSQGTAYAQQLGVAPGTQQSWDLAMQFGQMSAGQRYSAGMEASVRASIAGSVSSYLPGGLQDAYKYTQGYSSVAQVQPFQQLLAGSVGAGQDPNEVVGYEAGAATGDLAGDAWSSSTGMRPITRAEQLSRMAQQYGSYGLQQVSGTGNRLQRTGMDYDNAQALALGANMSFSDHTSFGQMFDYYSQFGDVSQEGGMQLMASTRGMSPYQAGQITSIGSRYAAAGMGADVPMAALSTLSGPQLSLVGAMAGGDRQAWSYASYGENGTNIDPANRFFDQSRQQIYKSDFGSFIRLGYAQAAMGNASAQNMVSGMPFMGQFGTALSQAQGFFGTSPNENYTGASDTEAMQAWADGGMQGRTALHRQRMAGFSLASAGVALEGIAMKRQYLWGQDEGGTWDAPAQGSMWNLQDRQRQMQFRSQLSSMNFGIERMDVQQGFARRSDALTGEMISVNRGYQDWTSGFNKETSLIQRDWQREDFTYKRQMSNIDFGWAMEDVNEAIRTTGGRQRRKLLEQRERMSFKHGESQKQGEQQEDRFEEMAAREDERYQKTIENIAEVRELEDEQRKLSIEQRETLYEMDREDALRKMEDYKEQHALQEQIIAKQREFQAAQLELQEKAAGIQAAAAVEQMNYNEEVAITSEHYEKISGEYENMWRYNPIPMLEKLDQVVVSMSDLKTSTVTGLTSMYTTMADRNVTVNINRLVAMMNNINHLDVRAINALISLLNKVD